MRSLVVFVLGALLAASGAFAADPVNWIGNFTCVREGRLPIAFDVSLVGGKLAFVKLSLANGNIVEGPATRQFYAETGESTLSFGSHVLRFSNAGAPSYMVGAAFVGCARR